MRHWNRILPLFTTLILLGACASAPQPESAQDSGLKEAQSILKNIASFKKLACDPMAVTTAINSSIFYSKCSSGGSNPASPPAAPTNLSVETQAGDYTGWFSWVNVASDASTVQIHYRQLEPFETDWSTLVSLDASRNSHVEEDYLEDGFKYDFQVKAVNNDGSTGSNIVTATIGAVTDKTPRPPINLGHSFSSTNTIGLIWESMSNNEDEFVIFRGRLSGALLEIDSTTEEEYLDEGLSPETRYFYQVSARNDVGNSGFSEGYISATTTEEPVVIPLAPLNVVATALSPNEIQLTWDDVSNNEDAFLIYRRSPSLSETEFSPAGMIIEGDNDDATPQNPIPMEYVDGNVSPEQTYIYYIIAIDSSTGTESLPSDPTDIVETPAEELPPLAVPENVVAQALSGSTVEVTWSYTPGGTPDGYCVHRFIPPTGAVLLVGEVQGASEIRFEDDSVTAGTTYAYAVSAFRGSCDSVVGEQSDSSETDTSTPAVLTRVLDAQGYNFISWNVDTPSDAVADVINHEVLNCTYYGMFETFGREAKDYIWPADFANRDFLGGPGAEERCAPNPDGITDDFPLENVNHLQGIWILLARPSMWGCPNWLPNHLKDDPDEWTDLDGDGEVDPTVEEWVDLDGNGSIQTGEWTDLDGDGQTDLGEWTDVNQNGVFDSGEWWDSNRNRIIDPGEWTDDDGDGEMDLGEWTDVNQNGVFETDEWNDWDRDRNFDTGEWFDHNRDGNIDYVGELRFPTRCLGSPTLQVEGELVPSDTPIPLLEGWNAISFLPTEQRSMAPCTEWNPNYPDICNMGVFENGTLRSLLSPFDDQDGVIDEDDTYLSSVQGFEAAGLTFMPFTSMMPFNNFWDMKPGYGYRINVTEDTTLIYQDVIPVE